MPDHRASITIAAPVHQVYALFGRFGDYPKFMSFVKDVQFVDERTTRWTVDIAGPHAWTAVNDMWIPDQQIGWHSIDGFRNSGRVEFTALGAERTQVVVKIDYEPPAGPIGLAGELLGIGAAFEAALQRDLNAFAAIVEAAPRGGLDANSSAYVLSNDRTTTEPPPRGDDDVPIVPGTSRASRKAL